MDTLRRYPRTADEAFKDATYASSITRYRADRSPVWRGIGWLLLMLVLIGAAYL